MKRSAILMALVAALALPGVVVAQGGRGFLFSRPTISLGFRAGYTLPRASSNIFDFPLDSLTLGRSDFGGPYFGGEVAVRVSERWDVALTAGWAGSRSSSEYVNWVDQDGFPIEQETEFETVSGALGAKYYLWDRGRAIGRFAWVPEKLTPFVSAGLGLTHYSFEQAGDFIDFQSPTAEVFYDELRTSGTGLSAYLSAGADFSLGRQAFLTAEARYNVGNGGTQGPYADFDNVDLAGLQLMGGVAIRW